MVDIKRANHSPEAAAFQGGERVPSITPEGQEMNRSITEVERVTAVPKVPGAEGTSWSSDAPEPGPRQTGGYGMLPPNALPDNRAHEGGDPGLDGDAQYGASPLRSARYDENHEAIADIAAGKSRSGHHGGQARYPNTQEPVRGPSGHDEQQLSRDITKNSR